MSACPLCAAPLPPSPRYPSRVCGQCEQLAVDESGRAVSFSNVSFSGGFVAIHADGSESETHECWIRGVACWADEAHFGGIVVQPRAPK